MSTTPTPNKGYEAPDQGSEFGAWGDVLNDEVFTYVDTNLGGLLQLSLSSSNVTLTTAQARNVGISCTGTLTGNVQITNPAIGFYVIENRCTGAFTVTLTNGVGTAVTIPANYRLTIFADATNGARAVTIGNFSNSSLDPFPSGSMALFLQAAVPTGWTLNTTYVNYLLKVSSSAGAVTGGSIGAGTVLARTSVDGHALTTAQIPAHSHTTNTTTATGFSGFSAVAQWMALATGTIGTATGETSLVGGGNAHEHTLELRAARVGTIIGVRNV